MLSMLRKLAFLAAPVAVGMVFVTTSSSLMAQTVTLNGTVKGTDGKGLKDAEVQITRTDMKGNYKTKTNKKGEWVHAGIPNGTYDISVLVEGKPVDNLKGFKANYQSAEKPIETDLGKIAAMNAARQKAMSEGQVTEEMAKGMSKEEKEAIEKQMKAREEQIKANKALNDAYNAGREAMTAKNWAVAISKLNEAAALDAKQQAIWGGLGDSYVGQGDSQTDAAEKAASYEKGIEAYRKSIEIADDAATRNQIGLTFGQKLKKYEEMKTELFKAAELDPAKAGMYYFNVGAICTNTGQADCALEAFRRVPEGDAKFADAQFQVGVNLVSKATTKADGTVVPADGTIDAFNRYLSLAPEGANAAAAKEMIATLGGKIDQNYKDPNAKVKGPVREAAPAKPAKKK
jgi:tetratricopeptide (TPR) repeat protein